MRIDRSVVTGLACGLSLVLALAAGGPEAGGAPRSVAGEPAPRWVSVLVERHGVRPAADGADGPRVVCLDDRAGTLARALASNDPRLAALCAAVDWAAPESALGARLGIATAPHLVLVRREPPAVLDACVPVAGARPEVSDVVAALARFAAHGRRAGEQGRLADLRARLVADPDDAASRLDFVRRLESAGLFADARAALDEGTRRERSTVGPLHRARAYRDLVASDLGDDAVARLVESLRSEADPRVLRAGWALVSTLRAESSGDRASLWRATRETYQRTREEDLVPMLEALIERFAAAPDALDALDRYFLKGRAAALAALAPDSPWPARAREALDAARAG
ncbi:MAG: hypothetical protein AAFP22_19335, partial [Planctomycetota bacterium]